MVDDRRQLRVGKLVSLASGVLTIGADRNDFAIGFVEADGFVADFHAHVRLRQAFAAHVIPDTVVSLRDCVCSDVWSGRGSLFGFSLDFLIFTRKRSFLRRVEFLLRFPAARRQQNSQHSCQTCSFHYHPLIPIHSIEGEVISRKSGSQTHWNHRRRRRASAG